MKWFGLSPRESEPQRDHDLADLKAGPSATAWKHSDRCNKCLSAVGHNEIMTEICLTCGRRFNILATDGAVRKIVRNGRWVSDLLYKGRHYTFDGKNWVPLEPTNG